MGSLQRRSPDDNDPVHDLTPGGSQNRENGAAPPGGGRDAVRRAGPCQAKASIGGQAQTRLRSPYAWSIRRTGGQYFAATSERTG